MKCLRNSFKKFYGRYPDLIRKYPRSVKDMIANSFPDSFHAVVSFIGFKLSFFLKYWFCHLECHVLSTDAGYVGCWMRQTTLNQSKAPGCVIGWSNFS